MIETNLQKELFVSIKNALPSHISLVDEIADLLNISYDSAYRRIRGEKSLEFDEICKLCLKFNVSFDQLISLKGNTYSFNGVLPTEAGYKFSTWLESMLRFFEFINGYQKKHFYWFVRDFPVFILFQVPELLAFKFFFWSKSILGDIKFENKKFSIESIDADDKDFEVGRKISRLYNNMPTSEIWNVENISATLRQLEYYKQLRVFQSSKDHEILYDKFEQLINQVEKQAELGKKFIFGEEAGPGSIDYCLYKNDLVLGDGISITEVGNLKITWMIHGFINIITTMDARFNHYTYEAMKNLIRKSTQISVIGELERKRFFDSLRERIQRSRLN
jgi:hypothetical protein